MMASLSPELSKKFRFFSFISMVLLVFVHGYNLNNRYLQPFTAVDEPMTVNAWMQYFLANGIFRFRIPMLFAISGYLFAFHDAAPHKERMKKRVRTLLVPYVLWSIIGLLIAVSFAHWSVTEASVYKSHLQPTDKPFEQYGFSDWLAALLWPTSFQLWFIRCLFFYNLLYPLLRAGLAKRPWILLGFFGLLWLSMFGFIIIEGEGLLFFSLGIWLCKKEKNVMQKPKWFSLPLFAFLFLFFSALKTLLAFKGVQWLGMFPAATAMILMHKFVVLSGLFVAWFGLDKLVAFCMRQPWFIHVSAYAFIIYALHVPLVTYLIDPAFQLTDSFPHYRWITFVFLPLLIIAFCMGCGFVLRRYVPNVYAVLTGNRGL